MILSDISFFLIILSLHFINLILKLFNIVYSSIKKMLTIRDGYWCGCTCWFGWQDEWYSATPTHSHTLILILVFKTKATEDYLEGMGVGEAFFPFLSEKIRENCTGISTCAGNRSALIGHVGWAFAPSYMSWPLHHCVRLCCNLFHYSDGLCIVASSSYVLYSPFLLYISLCPMWDGQN
jgi:hypothetical protein